jgi:hypothetical protein
MVEEALMPRVRKLSAAEIAALEQLTPDQRAQVAEKYDGYLAGFTIGDYGHVELHEGERRGVVRTRLRAAAKRRNLALRFRPGPGAAMIFHVVAPKPVVAPALAPAADQRRDAVARRAPALRRPLRRRQTAAERYREVLPRWMRAGGQGSRRAGSKRHGR